MIQRKLKLETQVSPISVAGMYKSTLELKPVPECGCELNGGNKYVELPLLGINNDK
jgi:hypothetical protein